MAQAKKKPAQAGLRRALKAKSERKSAAAEVRAALDDPNPLPTDDVPLPERRLGIVEQARPPPKPVRLLSTREVCRRVNATPPTIWSWQREGRFPLARVLSRGKVGWVESEVDAWILNLPVQTLKPPDEEPADEEREP